MKELKLKVSRVSRFKKYDNKLFPILAELGRIKKGDVIAVTKLDEEDYNRLLREGLNVFYHFRDSDITNGYAYVISGGKTVYLHRYIMNNPKGKVIDHVNRDKLDNRKKNLRITTSLENNLNVGIRKDNKSGITGVRWSGQKWLAQISINGKMKNLGRFNGKNEAVKAYELAKLKRQQ